MKLRSLILALPLLAAAPAAALAHPARGTAPGLCRAAANGEWSAHVNAMPGPGARRTLILTGMVGVKPAAHIRLSLAPEVMESHPPQYTVVVDISLPRRPTIDMLERRNVRGEWPVRGEVGAVHIRCGGRIVASIRDVVVAH
jgi:hypothetical protein